MQISSNSTQLKSWSWGEDAFSPLSRQLPLPLSARCVFMLRPALPHSSTSLLLIRIFMRHHAKAMLYTHSQLSANTCALHILISCTHHAVLPRARLQ